MTAQQLKNSILQMAVQGKLVPQDPNDEPASVLLERIRAEKERLIKEKKIKCEKNPSVIFKGADNTPYEKIGDEVHPLDTPFDIPESWEWVRLIDVCEYIQRGKSPKYSPIKKYPVVAQKCNQWSGFSIEKAQFIEPDSLSSYGPERLLQDNDLMWNSTGLGTLGRMAIYKTAANPYELAVADSHVTVIRPLKQFVLPEYLYYYFANPSVQSVIEDQADGTTKQKELATATIKAYLTPIPPLNEQRRILTKLSEVLPVVKSYGAVYGETVAMQEAFPEALKKSILQEAVQGKLVPQDPSDEPAEALLERIRAEKQRLIKEGKIKKGKHESVIFRRDNSHYEKLAGVERCIDDELPFEIPDFWKWVRITSIAALVTKGTTPRGGNVAYSDIGVGFLRAENVAGLDQLDLSKLNHIDEATHTGFLKRSILEADDVLITIAGTLGRTAIVKEENLPLNANQAVAIIRLVDSHGVDLRYLVYALNAPAIQDKLTAQKKITAIPNLTLEIISDCLIPIPPLNEQHRIVRRIEELLPLVKGL